MLRSNDWSDSVATSLSRKACFSNITTALAVSDCSGKQPNKAILLLRVLLLRMRCKWKFAKLYLTTPSVCLLFSE
uniref:Uncharacterized protein n=1 Tax=Glossina pallidipes TaxID=7398 RepID=A0A1A9Z700_GLOPL